VILNQNFYLGVSAFLDAGMVTSPYDFDKSGIPADQLASLEYDSESLHMGYGGGIRFVINNNFIVAADMGKAVKKQDGEGLNLYIGLNYLF
jgi:hypothetical protein